MADPGGHEALRRNCLISFIAGSNPAEGMDVLLSCLLLVVQVAAYATGRSLVQKSPTECVCLIVCDPDTSAVWRLGPDVGCCATKNKWHAQFDIHVFKSYLKFAHELYDAARPGGDRRLPSSLI